MLIDKKITVIDADVIAKQAVEKGKPAYGQIVEAFGKEILLENGGIDRKKLGAIVIGRTEASDAESDRSSGGACGNDETAG